MVSIAREFSPRYERAGDDVVTIDVNGLGRLFGAPRAIGEAIAKDASRRGVRIRVALAGTWTAARILASARPGVTVVERGGEAAALAPLALGILDKMTVTLEAERLRARPRDSEAVWASGGGAPREVKNADAEFAKAIQIFKSWGLKTLGELAALPASDLAARLGRQGPVWQALARGEDLRPLIPDLAEERFDGSIDLEWPIEGLEPLSFVLTRLLEPLSTRLERRDRGAAVLHVRLGLVTEDVHARRLDLPTPIRDVRTLRTLALLDLESHPPIAAIDRVTIVIDPTPGRVLQHTLFTRAMPTPEQISTLLARLGALMGQDRIGAPATVDSFRPGAFAMRAFATDHNDQRRTRGTRRTQDTETQTAERESLRSSARDSEAAGASGASLEPERVGVGPHAHEKCPPREVKKNDVMCASALRRCRQPVPARVAVDGDRPVRVTTDRRGFAGGMVVQCAGPWRTSGDWWSACGYASGREREARDAREASASGGGAPRESKERRDSGGAAWHRDEWDVALNDGAVYRIFRDRDTDAWFIDAVVD